MARAIDNSQFQVKSSTVPLMDPLTHAVIKETSKNLKYYIDVKHRENGFVANPKSPTSENSSFRTRFFQEKGKASRRHRDLSPTENHYRNILPNYQRGQLPPKVISPEKQMCRDELTFHMRDFEFSPKRNRKLIEQNIRLPLRRSASARRFNRDARPRTAHKLSRFQRDQLIDDAADALATLVRTRQSNSETCYPLSQSPLMYISRSLDPSPRPTNDSSRIRSMYATSSNSTLTHRTMSATQRSTDSKSNLDKNTIIAINSMKSINKIVKTGFLCQYKISVTTGDCNGASTDAPIRIKLYGSNGCTDFHELNKSENHHIPFSKGQVDRFTVQTYNVGSLLGITIGHDRLDMRSSWYIQNISIEDTSTNTIYDLECNSWLSVQSYDQKTMREFLVTSSRLSKIELDNNAKRNSTIDSDQQNENKSSSDNSTDTMLHLNQNTPDSDKVHSDRQTPKIHRRQQQHVSIGPTTVATRTASGTIYSIKSPRPGDAVPISIETNFNPEDFLPKKIPIHRFQSPVLSTASSDTELRGALNSGTRSPTPTPTLHRTGLQSIAEHEKIPRRSKKNSSKKPILDLLRPPTRLEQRLSSLSFSSDRSTTKQKKKK